MKITPHNPYLTDPRPNDPKEVQTKTPKALPQKTQPNVPARNTHLNALSQKHPAQCLLPKVPVPK